MINTYPPPQTNQIQTNHTNQTKQEKHFFDRLRINKTYFFIVLFAFIILPLGFFIGWSSFKRQKLPAVKKAPAIERKVNTDETLIEIKGNDFRSKSITITPQKIVIFRNRDDVIHRINSETYPGFISPDIYPNSEFTFVFNKPGTWSIYLDDNKNKKEEVTVQ